MDIRIVSAIIGVVGGLVGALVGAFVAPWFKDKLESRRAREEGARKKLSHIAHPDAIEREVQSWGDLMRALKPEHYDLYGDFAPMGRLLDPVSFTEERYKDFDHFTLGNDRLRQAVVVLLPKLPFRVIAYMLTNCRLFLIPEAKWKGILLPGRLLWEKAVIALPEALLDDPEELERIILRKLAHLWLAHETPIVSGVSDEEYDQQETEAEKLVKSWLEGGEGGGAREIRGKGALGYRSRLLQADSGK